jgi:hypothetical protein
MAQTAVPTPTVANPKPEVQKALSPTAELALDAAKRWTQAAVADASHLTPLERDILLIRLAGIWKDVGRAKAQEYLKDALDHFRSDADPDASPVNAANYSMALESVSEELRELDRKAWDSLMEELPKWNRSGVLAREANDLAIDDDVAGAMELESESLQNGGSMIDVHTLESIIDTDPVAASKLFDQILSTAAKPTSDLNLLPRLVEDAFPQNADEEAGNFFNKERQQSVLNTLAQLALVGKPADACNYYGPLMQAMPHFSPSLQGQLRSIASQCRQQHQADDWPSNEALASASTDDLLAAMESASKPQRKRELRQLAVRHALEVDHDYVRAIELSLSLSQPEREQLAVGAFEIFDSLAHEAALAGIRAAIQKNDEVEIRRILDVLPQAMRVGVELEGARTLHKSEKPRALLMLTDARRVLEGDQTIDISEEGYKLLLIETSELSPSDVTSAWRVLVPGLNGFEEAQRIRFKALAGRSAFDQNGTHPSKVLDFLYPWPLPESAIQDENFVRASIDDLGSVENREKLRAGVIGAFLSRYDQAMKQPSKASGEVLTAAH